MSAVDTKFYEKRKSSTFYMALGFLLLVIALTSGIFFYNNKLEKQNIDLASKINQIEASITSVEQDPNLQVYSIYEKHSVLLQKLENYSKIPSFVSHLKKHFAIHGLDGKGFTYSQGLASVDLSAQTNENGYAYQKIVKFLKDYKALGDDALFTAEFVSVVDGYDRINFTGEFKLK